MAWLLYGAYGYTGKLILDAALRRGLRPVVGGRDADRTEALAERHELRHRVFSLEDPVDLVGGVHGMEAVLNAAGPFSETFRPMVGACMAAGAHYLDITGEIAVLESAFELSNLARAREVAVIPGVGFDVVPTDCLAARVAARVEDPVSIDLAFAASGGPSRGTIRTAIQRLGGPSKVRRDGSIEDVPLGSVRRRVPFAGGAVEGIAIPWGDVSTAYHSTGVGNVRVFTQVPPAFRVGARLFGPVLRRHVVRRAARSVIEGRIEGPDEAELRDGRSHVWCEVRAADGEITTAEIRGPNPYRLTAEAAAAAVGRVLGGFVEERGTLTPSRAFGDGFVFALEGVERVSG